MKQADMLAMTTTPPAMEGYLATISIFAGNLVPRGWMFCEGQLMSIAQNTALYSLIGAKYGGDNMTNFKLPDLRDAVPGGAQSGLHYIMCVNGQYPASE
jgi:microcystin-dependent protein